ncbi:ankyrin repeat and MYND domain-containing protein 1-like [Genypterus blacodes]|uniref:ankyrin repeat and MYND domain-containing protein 1-like n=1 Tax=Genypterus blacodes TaxID=154954 RepID=UPI003F777FCA
MSSTSKGVVTAQRRGEEPGTETQSIGHRGGQARQGRREALGIQEWPDGSRYEGGFIQGLKHGTGRYTWKNGETYVGSFYRDFRHGGGSHCWHTGEKFTGKFYLNRKEGYGLHVYHDGSSFHGLYYIDQRFGPGVITYWDGLQDVGLWDRQYLLRLCTAVGEGFSLRSFPKYAVFLDPAVSPGSLLQNFSLCNAQVKARTPHRDLLLDDHVILSPSIERYSTDGDHLPLPGGRRRELDRHFYGKQWKPVPRQYQGYERDPLSLLPLQARMQAHIEKHRLQAVDMGWDVAAVLSLSRDGFGPKGPVEVSSELLLQQASRGEQQAISQLFLTDMVHPDVTDSTGLTALIAATINCHNDVIHLLLDRGADIDKLNSEGMSALAVCHVLYYPVHSLHMNCLNPGAKTESLSTCGSTEQTNLVDFTAEVHQGPSGVCYSRPQTGNTTLSSNQNHPSDQRRARLDTLMLLLDRGADANASMIPMPVLFLAVLAADTEVVNRLLMCGARTNIRLPPERKGLYPLHVAAALPGPTGPRITELLLLTGTNPDAQACDQDQAPFQRSMKTHKALSTRETPQHTSQEATREPKEGGHTALHVACQRFSDYRHASEVVSLLLSYGASTHLLWSGHSPLSLAIANDNELAVDSLLKGGADPNLQLGRRVGSALCVLARIKFFSGGRKIDMLNRLVKGGVNVSMPVIVNDIVGTAIDFAYYSFNQDIRIAKTPFHALTMQERETLKERKLLLSMMGDLMRQAVASMESEKPPPKFCYQCGRSASVKLTLCSRCRLVFYCSTKCKLKAWDQRHKDECVRVSAKAKAKSAGTQGRGAGVKSPNDSWPWTRGPKPIGY